MDKIAVNSEALWIFSLLFFESHTCFHFQQAFFLCRMSVCRGMAHCFHVDVAKSSSVSYQDKNGFSIGDKCGVCCVLYESIKYVYMYASIIPEMGTGTTENESFIISASAAVRQNR